MPKRLKNLSKIRSYLDWPKVKPGEVLIVPSDNRLIEYPPYLNAKGWPKWFKEPEIAKAGSIVSCKGIQDYLSLGMTVPLWCDMEIFPIGPDLAGRTSDNAFTIEHFSYDQTRECPITKDRELPNAGFPKPVSPFLYKTAPGYSMLALPVAYEPDPRYQVLPAVIHTDYYHNLNVVLRVMTGESFIISAGTPIYHLIPFKRSDKLSSIQIGDEMMHHHGSHRGIARGNIGRFTRRGSYRKHQRQQDA